ncbi:MAG TPA: SURF1 family protein [Acidiphilium sp.]|nr:MAG: hypothetical protein B7Z67_10700 [Acidiphilium sp. 21-60-14]OYV91309.1 MAG: hypothetical protein B7Z57_05395 [Acidiphilium sp. 37-60-79]OZB40772.1 MAG: hypothetical protein B7X48_03655 [Acidiphilium sp. 34-60-192]HQT88842.1 SURF1 family protein [Acidiphilium sp.]HQU23748.1 SURF1 family protein [Acidiphilium sp.]
MSGAIAPPARWRRLIGMGVISVIAFAGFIALGIWQVHRYHHKAIILSQITRAQLRPPVPMGAHPSPYQKVAVTGHWIFGHPALYGDQIRNFPQGAVQGAQLVMPFQRDDGSIVMVDLGWVAGRTPHDVPLPSGPTMVSGYVQAQELLGMFRAKDDLADKIFYTLDARTIGHALGLHRVAKFTLIALGPKPLAGGPIPAASLPHPPNNSKQYYLTWFGLALVVPFEFFFYARKILREKP